ncbi:MAG: peptidase U32 family protein, partial [Coriobacteriia bacterium]|nr:peptidase U32 family protein [Coriobacteriia bacterium]
MNPQVPNHSMLPAPELLAPAGGPEALRAAVNNGADAVYLGVDRLNARQGAENFTLKTLPDVTRFAHLKGVRVYLTANVVVVPDEMNEALSLVDEAWAAGVDAVIVQDLGLARAVHTELPDVRLHASTQIGAHNAPTVAELARTGFSRVTLARETSAEEIAGLVAASDIEVESFIHGALCVSYSGGCFMSSLIGGRSANRGQCAQPCRLAYELLDEKSKSRASVGAHLLSPKDLCGIDHLPRLVS